MPIVIILVAIIGVSSVVCVIIICVGVSWVCRSWVNLFILFFCDYSFYLSCL